MEDHHGEIGALEPSYPDGWGTWALEPAEKEAALSGVVDLDEDFPVLAFLVLIEVEGVRPQGRPQGITAALLLELRPASQYVESAGSWRRPRSRRSLEVEPYAGALAPGLHCIRTSAVLTNSWEVCHALPARSRINYSHLTATSSRALCCCSLTLASAIHSWLTCRC